MVRIGGLLVLMTTILGLTLTSPVAASVISAGEWSSFLTPDQAASPFWGGSSWDQASGPGGCGAGNLLTGPNNCDRPVTSLDIPSSDLQFMHATGDQNAAVGFGLDDRTQSVSFLFEITAWDANNQLWWYDLHDPGSRGLLIDGAQSPATTSVVTIPAAQWGLLYFTQETGGATHTYYSGTGAAQTGFQQFALFQQKSTGDYFVGIEDIPVSAPSNDFDYNDSMVRIVPSSKVPLPGTLVLVGSGLACLALLQVRRRKTG